MFLTENLVSIVNISKEGRLLFSCISNINCLVFPCCLFRLKVHAHF